MRRYPARSGPQLPAELEARVGQTVAVFHVCERFVLYRNNLNGLTNMFERRHGRWKWRQAWDSEEAGKAALARILAASALPAEDGPAPGP